jgi:hypothetical protein
MLQFALPWRVAAKRRLFPLSGTIQQLLGEPLRFLKGLW